MLKRKWFLLGGIVLVVFIAIAFSFSIGLSGANTIPASHLGSTSSIINADALKPVECAGIAITNIIIDSGNIKGTTQNDLILGSPGVDKINGKGGIDCILGGGGDDDIAGTGAGDVCIGGPGNDTFSKCDTIIQ
jgi:Ca2+-binding RTX toxin-like protein